MIKRKLINLLETSLKLSKNKIFLNLLELKIFKSLVIIKIFIFALILIE